MVVMLKASLVVLIAQQKEEAKGFTIKILGEKRTSRRENPEREKLKILDRELLKKKTLLKLL